MIRINSSASALYSGPDFEVTDDFRRTVGALRGNTAGTTGSKQGRDDFYRTTRFADQMTMQYL